MTEIKINWREALKKHQEAFMNEFIKQENEIIRFKEGIANGERALKHIDWDGSGLTEGAFRIRIKQLGELEKEHKAKVEELEEEYKRIKCPNCEKSFIWRGSEKCYKLDVKRK